MNHGLSTRLKIVSLLGLLVNSASQAHSVAPNTDKNSATIAVSNSAPQTANAKKQSDNATQNNQLAIKQVAEGIYEHKSYLNVTNFGLVEANGLVVVQDNQAYIIDTPWTDKDTAKLLEWITLQGFTAVASISTHSHQDRAGGIGYLNSQGINTIVSETTQLILADSHKSKAQTTFTGKHYSVKADLIEVYDLGAGHTQDNLVVWLPKQKILFGGCLIKSLDSTNMGYTGEADMKAWPLTLNKLQQQFPQVNLVIPGHGASGDMSLVSHTMALIAQYNQQHSQTK